MFCHVRIIEGGRGWNPGQLRICLFFTISPKNDPLTPGQSEEIGFSSPLGVPWAICHISSGKEFFSAAHVVGVVVL